MSFVANYRPFHETEATPQLRISNPQISNWKRPGGPAFDLPEFSGRGGDNHTLDGGLYSEVTSLTSPGLDLCSEATSYSESFLLAGEALEGGGAEQFFSWPRPARFLNWKRFLQYCLKTPSSQVYQSQEQVQRSSCVPLSQVGGHSACAARATGSRSAAPPASAQLGPVHSLREHSPHCPSGLHYSCDVPTSLSQCTCFLFLL